MMTARASVGLIGIGAEGEFAAAETICVPGLSWIGSFREASVLRENAGLPDRRVILLDGDTSDMEALYSDEGGYALLRHEAVVLQTTRPSVRFVVSAFRRGIADVLAKPYHIKQLADALRDVLRGSRFQPFDIDQFAVDRGGLGQAVETGLAKRAKE